MGLNIDMENDNEEAQKFYDECAHILGRAPNYKKFPFRKRTRWNNRTAGNGRFADLGIIRRFGSQSFHVSLRHTTTKHFRDAEQVYEFLRRYVENESA